MENFILVTILATHPITSSVLTKEACVAAQQEADAKHCMAMCLDVRLINNYTLLTSSGLNKVHAQKD